MLRTTTRRKQLINRKSRRRIFLATALIFYQFFTEIGRAVNGGETRKSLCPSMSHFQLCAYVASGAVATPCVAFIDPADTRRRRSGKGVWNIDARIKHPCNFPTFFPTIKRYVFLLCKQGGYHFLQLVGN